MKLRIAILGTRGIPNHYGGRLNIYPNMYRRAWLNAGIRYRYITRTTTLTKRDTWNGC